MTREQRQQKRLNDALKKQSPEVKRKVVEAQAAGVPVASILAALFTFIGPILAPALIAFLQNLITNHKEE